jgi:ABC transporter substrate binding protein
MTFLVGDDPVRLGLVTSLSRPGGNMTGINIFNSELAAKRLELLRELVPRAARVAVFVNPADAVTETQLKDVGAAARAMGLQIQIQNANTSAEIDAAFEMMGRERPDAVFVGTSAFLNGRRVQLAQLAAFHRLPATYAQREYPEVGGADELRIEHCGWVSSGWPLYRSHPQGREAGGLAGRAGDEIRASHQRSDRQNAWPHRAGQVARRRRRGDRMKAGSVQQ